MSAKTTPLYPLYKGKARTFNFEGWEMPLWFTSIEDEHMAVRTNAGVFDISHMTRTRIEGREATLFLDYALTAKISGLKAGRLAYTYVLNENGGIIDDGIVFSLSEDSFVFVTNACTHPKLFLTLKQRAKRFPSVRVEQDSENNAMIALQGPNSLKILKQKLSLDMSQKRKFELVTTDSLIVSRSGYTGEDGVEIIGNKERTSELFQAFIEAGAKPCGLGARDTLRLEMGYPLGCVDINESVNPYEVGGERFVDFTKDFVGKSALLGIKPTRRLRGVISDTQVVLRSGYEVTLESGVTTRLTSGTLSPILKKGIALAFFPLSVKAGERGSVKIRAQEVLVSVVDPPFIKK